MNVNRYRNTLVIAIEVKAAGRINLGCYVQPEFVGNSTLQRKITSNRQLRLTNGFRHAVWFDNRCCCLH